MMCEYMRRLQLVKSVIAGPKGEAISVWIASVASLPRNDTKQEVYEEKYNKYKEIGRMLGSMVNNPEKFLPRNNNY